MRRRAQKETASPTEELPEISSSDRHLLSQAYKIGLITGWKRDGGGYRVTHGDRRDEYVATTDLGSYLERVRAVLPRTYP
jgi:hypothetical protein